MESFSDELRKYVRDMKVKPGYSDHKITVKIRTDIAKGDLR